MSSALSVDESKFSRFISNFEDAVFGVVYNLRKAPDEDLTRINYLTGIPSILLDFFQVLPFLVHGMF